MMTRSKESRRTNIINTTDDPNNAANNKSWNNQESNEIFVRPQNMCTLDKEWLVFGL